MLYGRRLKPCQKGRSRAAGECARGTGGIHQVDKTRVTSDLLSRARLQHALHPSFRGWRLACASVRIDARGSRRWCEQPRQPWEIAFSRRSFTFHFFFLPPLLSYFFFFVSYFLDLVLSGALLIFQYMKGHISLAFLVNGWRRCNQLPPT